MKNIFKLSSLVLLAAFALTLVSSNALGGPNRRPVSAAGVISPLGDILFAVDENFIASRIGPGIYLIEVDERLECRFRADGQQAALGPRLATPTGVARHTSSPLFFVPSDTARVCNDSSVYVIQVWDRFLHVPADGAFNFRITGIIDRNRGIPSN